MSFEVTLRNGVVISSEHDLSYWDLLKIYEDYQDTLSPEAAEHIYAVLEQKRQALEANVRRLAKHDPSPWQTGTPPGPGEYLITFELGNGLRDVMQAEWVDDWGVGFKWLDGRSSIIASVLAWQPLPEPYRGEG
jgi:hypothetical protein